MKSNPQNEIFKTAIAAVAACAMVGSAVGVYYTTQPSPPSEYAKVDQAFFESFTSSQQITSMVLEAMDADGKLQSFQLEKKDGLWIIPTHHDYPAEAGERLSQTATSLLGLVRLRLASSARDAQGRLGVLNPESEEAQDSPEEAGKLLRFKDVNDETIFE